MNKKGFLLGEETLKIVIAVICIMFLVLLLARIYYSLSDDSEGIRQAEATLEKIINDLSAESTEIVIFNPTEGNYGALWSVNAWSSDGPYSNKCRLLSVDNCVCIVKTTGIDWATIGISESERLKRSEICSGFDKKINIVDGENSYSVLDEAPIEFDVSYGNEVTLTRK